MRVRLAAAGWENFTGSFGFQAEFRNGVSVNELTPRQIARIASTTKVVNAETGEQVGPSVIALLLQGQSMTVATPVKTLVEVEKEEADIREQLAREEDDRKAAEAAALAEAQVKAEEAAKEDEIVIYSRQELEAIAANDGIQGLREIAKPLGVKGRAIDELVREILAAQNEKVAG